MKRKGLGRTHRPNLKIFLRSLFVFQAFEGKKTWALEEFKTKTFIV